ncbi:MAG: O-antigen ligase family protein [Actinomycetes bacterium]
MLMTLLAATTAALPLLVPRGPGNTAPVDIFAALFVLAVVVQTLLSRRRGIVVPAAGPLLLIALVSASAVLFSVAPGTGLLNLLIEAYLVALLWAACSELRGRPDRMAVITSVWAVAAVFWAFLLVGTQWHLLPGGLQHLLLENDSSGRAAAAARNPNLAASFLVTSVFVVMASPWPRSRLVRGGIYAWLMTAVVVSGSNGALLGAAAGGVLLLALRIIRRSSRIGRSLVRASVAVAAGIAIFAVAEASPTVNQATADKIAQSSHSNGALRDNVGRINNSVSTRVSIWSSALHGGFDHSALGVGVGEAQTIQVGGQALGKSLHNDVLAFLLERGVVGLAALLLLVAVVLRWSSRLARAGPVRIDGRLWRLQGLAAAVTANLVISLTHESYHFRHLWLLLALVWAASDLVAVRSPARVPAPARSFVPVPMRSIRVPA